MQATQLTIESENNSGEIENREQPPHHQGLDNRKCHCWKKQKEESLRIHLPRTSGQNVWFWSETLFFILINSKSYRNEFLSYIDATELIRKDFT